MWHEKRLPGSLRTIATAQRFTSLRAGWRGLKEILPSQEEQFAAAVNKEPNNDLYQFNLAALQIRSSDTEKSNNAGITLERLSKIMRYRTGALRALLNDAVDRNDLASADSLAQQLQMSPDVTFGDYLLCLNFYRKLDPKKFRQVLERVKPFAARNAADVAALINWMNQNGLAADVVEWIDKLPPVELRSPAVSVAVADAYATVKNWSRLKRFTRTGSWGDADYLRLAFQAIAVQHLLSGSSSSNSEFKKSGKMHTNVAENDSQRQLTLARLATKWQLASEAEPLWLAVEKNPSMRREALDNLRRIYRAQERHSRSCTKYSNGFMRFLLTKRRLPLISRGWDSTLSKTLNIQINSPKRRMTVRLTKSTAL